MHVIPATLSSRTPFREGISIPYCQKEMPRQAGHDSAQGMTTCILFISFTYIVDNSVKAGFYGTHSA